MNKKYDAMLGSKLPHRSFLGTIVVDHSKPNPVSVQVAFETYLVPPDGKMKEKQILVEAEAETIVQAMANVSTDLNIRVNHYLAQGWRVYFTPQEAERVGVK